MPGARDSPHKLRKRSLAFRIPGDQRRIMRACTHFLPNSTSFLEDCNFVQVRQSDTVNTRAGAIAGANTWRKDERRCSDPRDTTLHEAYKLLTLSLYHHSAVQP